MGMMSKPAHALNAVAAVLASTCGPGLAQDASVAELAKPESSVSVGAGHWSNDRPQQGIYDGMRDGGAYLLFDADLIKRDDATGTWLGLRARNLGLDTREIRAEWLRQGNMGVFLEHSRTPRDLPLGINTGLRGIGTTSLTVSGAGANALPFAQVGLGTKRDFTQLGFSRNLVPGLDFKVSFKNEEKDGTRLWGRGGQPEFAVEPINSTTRQLEAFLEYSGQNLQLSGGYYGSWYDNAHGLVDTIRNGDNPATLANHVYLSLPLDNQAHQVFLNGGYNITPTTRGTFKLAYTHATQNEHLPSAAIAGLSDPRAPARLGGRVDTTLVQLGLTSRPMAKLSLLANLRYHDMRDQTPQARFVFAANCLTGTCVDNTPLSFRTLTGKVEGTYRLPQQFNLIGGLERRDQDRTVPVGVSSVTAAGVDTQRYVPFRAQVDETTYRVQVRRSMSETINGSIAFLHSKRDGSPYTRTNEAESDEINPLHIADRKRNKWRLSLDWSALEQLSLQFNVEDARDDYATSAARPYGLRDGSAALYSIDATYALNDQWQLTAWYSHDKTKATQFSVRAANAGASSAEKTDRLEDAGDSLGIGVHGQVAAKIKLGADLQWTRNKSKYPEAIAFTDGGTTLFPTSSVPVSPLPDIENKLIRLKLFATYALQKNADIRLDLIHERWRTDDWSWLFSTGMPFTYGTTTDGTTVTADSKQTSNFVGVRFVYRFH